MRLKKLVLIGFKSFAEKTILHFDKGITCIVGPNGCGKSNIADAFRWVLGEQSAKSMRGNKMPDVIFAGTSQRKPLNFAEVSLTLTEVQGTLPIDYEEITLTRRLHRSGESEYFINGNPVRLKDVQSLFLDSGIGRNAFSIFEQGKLDQVISYTPLERRHIFEEAAGILRFLQRKKEALKRLEQADLNFSRVKDIHQEVEKHIQTLQAQAEKALVFKENKTQLEGLEKAAFALRWNSFDKKRGEIADKQLKQQELLRECQEESVLKHNQGEEIKLAIQLNERNLKAKNEELFTVRNEKELLLRDQQAQQQRLQEIQQKEKKVKRELEELALAKQTRVKALQEIEQKQKMLEEEFKEIEAKLSHQQDKVKFKEKEVLQMRQDLQAKHQMHLKILQQENQFVSDIKQAEVRLENNQERKKQLEKRKSELVEELTQLAQILQEKRKHLQQVAALVDSHKDRLDQYEEELKLSIQENETRQKEAEGLRRKVMEGKARQKVLLRMREDHEGFSSGSKRLLQESQNKSSLFYQKLRPLYEFLSPSPEAAEALAVILRLYSQTLVVDAQTDFEHLIQFAEKEGIQDYSLVCIEMINKLQSNSKIENKGSFLKFVASNPLAEHFLKNVDRVASHEEALALLQAIGQREGWSVQGAFIDYRGVFFKVKPSENQVFLRESELKQLEEELLDKEGQVAALEQKLLHLQQRRAQLQMERAELDKMLRRDEMKLVEVNFGVQRALGDQEKLKAEQEQNEKDRSQLEQLIDQQAGLLKDLQDKHFVLRQELIQQQQERDVLQVELDKQEGALRIQLQDQKEKGETYRQLSENKHQLLHQARLLEVKEQDHEAHVLRLTEELEESGDQQALLKEKAEQHKQIFAAIENRLAESAEGCNALEKERETLKADLEALEKEFSLHYEKVKKVENDLTQLKIQEAHIASALEALSSELYERYQLTIEDILKFPLPLDKTLEQTEKQIRSLRQALQAAGDVNLTSIEELEKQKVRYDFLSQQLGDMQHSKEELLQIITQLDGESRKLFKETFEAIRSNFKKNFEILFNGGEADLQFTETDNILEAGIEISAKPPGKQMRSISLLSGGEKCLTAVALLFAIFEVKSAPFCILDEIDAPLDDSNVERFVNVVKHFIDRCQFLIVTHNKRTMAIGDVLFGVSMEEKGVSKLLSLEFAHEATPEVAIV
ncbi:chromosome segregation protein SMC [Candidatus Protochlamydia phocaeensis]|uniref:chromosome segregation protein SMC n=1 Tax=Candidatus Protochlamydia phocaeensis TaxID=1414722 RepID=UPI000838B11D|nr:chromosome segregation protein SMC [Candidatus Protochlamydia phocaeensis]